MIKFDDLMRLEWSIKPTQSNRYPRNYVNKLIKIEYYFENK